MNVTAPSAPGGDSAPSQTSSQTTDPSSTKPDGNRPESSKPEQLADRPSLFERLSGFFRQRNGASVREEIVDALAESASDEEAFSPTERTMLSNILGLREVHVEDVMIPRADVHGIELTTTLGQLMVQFEETGHSRMPVYHQNLDDPRGMIHIRDVVAHLTRAGRVAGASAALDLSAVDLSRTIEELGLIRHVLFVPPSMPASDLMARMQASRTQMALVIDEYGGTDGLVSLEDIVEMIVGDIEDEHDDEETMITKTGEGTYVVDGKAEIDDVVEVIGDAFSAGEYGETVDTIGGLILSAVGRVPIRGEVVHAIPGFEIHVLDADPRRVKRIRIVEDPEGRAREHAEVDANGESQPRQ